MPPRMSASPCLIVSLSALERLSCTHAYLEDGRIPGGGVGGASVEVEGAGAEAARLAVLPDFGIFGLTFRQEFVGARRDANLSDEFCRHHANGRHIRPVAQTDTGMSDDRRTQKRQCAVQL